MPDQSTESLSTQVCIAGGGPAGMMLGLLLAKAGIKVMVLEKHGDFLRDFRGDTVHPSTLEVLRDLGLLERFLQRPHDIAQQVSAVVSGVEVPVADFRFLPTQAHYVAFMPQWEFLDFLAHEAKRYSTFSLLMETAADGLMEAAGEVVGLTARSREKRLEIRAELVVAADGRSSKVRALAGMEVIKLGAPIDALWMRLSRRREDPPQLFGRFDQGQIFVMLNRGDYWQCATVIPKGAFDALQAQGLPAFRQRLKAIAPFLGARVEELQDWAQIKLLSVQVDRLKTWSRPGLLCIGDAAHAMSPVGGVGINLAIQDAVATANLLTRPLLEHALSAADLDHVQARRELPTVLTQKAQLMIHSRIFTKVLNAAAPLKLPLALRLAAHVPWLRRVPAYLIGVGVRPERPRVVG